MSTQVSNTSANLSGKKVLAAENSDTVTGLLTFDRGAATAPFAVGQATAAKVANLDADKLDGLDSTDFIKKDGTVAMTGALNLGTPGQIQFPATQNPSAGANVLDDYEEGTWTPVLAFGGASVGITYGTQTGTYTKVGRVVTAEWRVVLTSKGSSTGSATVSLPFAISGTPTGSPIDFVVGNIGSQVTPFQVGSGSTVFFGYINSSFVRGLLTEANFTNTTEVRGTITYFV